jgi:hypothetical protein
MILIGILWTVVILESTYDFIFFLYVLLHHTRNVLGNNEAAAPHQDASNALMEKKFTTATEKKWLL